jgi:hypothetical protein
VANSEIAKPSVCVCVCVCLCKSVCVCLNINKYIYRVIQEESAILWEMIVCVILRIKVHINMGPILNGYGVMTA